MLLPKLEGLRFPSMAQAHEAKVHLKQAHWKDQVRTISDEPDEIVHPNTTKDEGIAIKSDIIAKTVTVLTKQGDSSEAPILTH